MSEQFEITQKEFQQIRMAQPLKIKKDIWLSMEIDDTSFMRNEVNLIIEKFCAADLLADEVYYADTEEDFPASPWQFFKLKHESSWWLGWLVRRRPPVMDTHTNTASFRVKRYLLYPDAVIKSARLGAPIIYEHVEEVS